MPEPLPPGGDPGTVQSESFYEGLIKKYWGADAAKQYAGLYKKYAKDFPPTPTESTAYQIFNPFAAVLAVGGGVKSAAKAVADAVAKVSKTTATSLPTLPDPLAAIAAFFRSLTDASVWRSLGWLVLGAVLLIVGVWLWLKKQDVLPGVMPV